MIRIGRSSFVPLSSEMFKNMLTSKMPTGWYWIRPCGKSYTAKKRQLTSSQRHLNGNKTQVIQKGLGGGISQSKGESQNITRICKTPLNANAITLTNSLLTQFYSFDQALLYILPQFPISDRNASTP